MASPALRARRRQRARASLAAHSSINLVPLVDILTSIVFFSLLTYRGELLARLTAYDLTLPPAVVRAQRPAGAVPVPLDLVVRVGGDGLVVEHASGGGVSRRVAGVRGAALDTLGVLVAALRLAHPAERAARVAPADGVAYEDVIAVLDRLRVAGFSDLALGGSGGAASSLAPAR